MPAIIIAQPINDDCDGIIDLGVAPICPDTMIYTNIDASASDIGFGNIPECFNGGSVQRDVWFMFTSSDTIFDYTITVTGVADGVSEALMNPQIAFYRGDCTTDGLAELACASAEEGENVITLDLLGLTPNTTFFLRINDYSSTTPNWGTFQLCIEEQDSAYTIDEGSSTDCTGVLYDSGGSDGDYENNEDHTFTICPDQPHDCIEFTLASYFFEPGWNTDILTIYDGDTPGPDNIIGQLGGSSQFLDSGGGGVCYRVKASSGCITINFTSDGASTFEGFAAQWECTNECSTPSVITVAQNIPNEQIVETISASNIFVEITNIDCPSLAYGTFEAGDNSELGLERGLLLTTGAIFNAVGPNNNNGLSTTNGTAGDDDLDYLSGVLGNGTTSNDACVVEMDVIPAAGGITFEYVFGSEEYPEFVNEIFNDIFAFFISGPGIDGDANINNQLNLATLPDGMNTPVQINSVNQFQNWEYFRNNDNGISIEYDGLTSDYLGLKKSLTAQAQVQPCSTYHLKLAIADRGDFINDSGVFIAELEGSINIPNITAQFNNGINYLVEGCNTEPETIIIGLFSPAEDTLTYSVDISGTANIGEDYIFNIPDTITFLPGQSSLSFPIQPLADMNTEGTENIIISLTNDFGCGEVVYNQLELELEDQLPIEILNPGDTISICQDSSILLEANGGSSYFWTPVNVFDNPVSPTPIASPAVSQWVFVEGIVGACVESDSIYLEVDDSAGGCACNRVQDSLALIEFHQVAGGDNWLVEWDLSGPIDNWAGVSLNTEGCVECFDLGILNNCGQAVYNENNMNGILPDFNLTQLVNLSIGIQSGISGNIPNFSHMPQLERLFLVGNNLEGTIPDFIYLPNLHTLNISANQLTRPIPDFSNLDQLEWLNISGNPFGGTPPLFSNLPNLQVLELVLSEYDNLVPDYSIVHPNIEVIDVRYNQLSFEYLLPNIEANSSNCLSNGGAYIYAPQDSIFTDTLISATEGSLLEIDLGIDDTVTTNVYQWYKDGQPFTTINGDNRLIFDPVQAGDAGTYWVHITNPNAPELTLESYAIVIETTLNSNDTGCESALDLGQAPYCENIVFSNIGATPTDIGTFNIPSCTGEVPMKDVWFQFTSPANTGNYTITVTGTGATPINMPFLAIYREYCPISLELACSYSNTIDTIATLHMFDDEPNTIRYLRVDNRAAMGGEFNICIEENPQDDCLALLDIGNDTVINLGDSLMLDVSNWAYYDLDYGFINAYTAPLSWVPAASTTMVALRTSGFYVLSTLDEEGCIHRDTINMGIRGFDLSDAQLSTDTICSGQDAIIELSGLQEIAFIERVFQQEFSEEVFDIKIVDLDGDSDQDIVTAHGNVGNKLNWYENDGTKTFTEHVIANTGLSISFDVEDIDQDGDKDLGAFNVFSDKIYWFENDGAQSFTEHLIDDTVESPNWIRIHDIDNDNDFDLLAASKFDTLIVWYENNNQQFTRHIVDSTTTARNAIAIDFDQDNDTDLISASTYDQKISWYEQMGSNNFVETVLVQDVEVDVVNVIDFDADGDLDIVSGPYEGGTIPVSWYENDGNFNFSQHFIPSLSDAGVYFVSSINNDVHLDFLSLYATPGSEFEWHKNDGNQNFTAYPIPNSLGGERVIRAADLSGDGLTDLFCAYHFSDATAWYEQIDISNLTFMVSIDGNTPQEITNIPNISGNANLPLGNLSVGPHLINISQIQLPDGHAYAVDFNTNLLITESATTINEVLCNNDSLNINGTTYDSTNPSGAETITLPDGCDSLIYVNLSFYPAIEETINAEICSGQSYDFGGSQYTATGNYEATFMAANGCDSLVHLALNVTSTLSSSFAESICEGEVYTWNNQDYNTAGNYEQSFTTAEECDSIVTLNLQVQPLPEIINIPNTVEGYCAGTPLPTLNVDVSNGASADWYTTPIGGTPIAQNSTNFTPNQPGIYYVGSIDLATGCVSGQREAIEVVEWPTASTSISLQSCNSQEVGLDTILLSTSFGCDSMVITNTMYEPLEITESNLSTCQWDEVGLYTDTLASIEGCDSILITNITFDLVYISQLPDALTCDEAQIGTDTIFSTATNGCDSLILQNWFPAPAVISETDTTICDGAYVLFGGEVLESAGTYTDSLQTALGCDSLSILHLGIQDSILVQFNDYLCGPEPYYFGNSIITAPGSYIQLLTSDAGCDSTVVLQLEAIPINELEITDDEALIIAGASTATFSLIDNDILPDSTLWNIELSTLPSQGNATLSPAGDLVYNLANNSFLGIDSFIYRICLPLCGDTCLEGAIRIATLRDCLSEIEANLPTGFTPDGDGINDFFDPLGGINIIGCLQNPENAELSILTTWNEIIYQPSPYAPWDGRVNGEIVPQGTYYYILRFEEVDEVIFRKPIHVLK